jgi:hypothetical protein
VVEIDVLTRLGGSVMKEEGGTRVRLDDVSVILGGRSPEQVAVLLNDAIHKVIGRYSANIVQAGIALPTQDVERLACIVVLHRMYVLNGMVPPDRRSREWIGFSEYDMTGNEGVRDVVRRFCSQSLGHEYHRYAAAVLGTSTDEFVAWEKRRIEFLEMW